MGKFVISEAKTGYKFNLKAGNGEIIAASQVYKSLASCKKGVASVQVNAPVAAIEDQTFTGKAVEPAVTVTLDGQALAAGQDYTVEYADNTAVGTATAVIKGQAGFTGEKAVTFAIVKADNPMTAKGATKTVKLAKVKKAKQTIAAVTVKNAEGKVTYKKASGKFAVNTKNGKITVPKGTKKGTYKIKVKVTAAGNDSYNKLTKTVTATIKVK